MKIKIILFLIYLPVLIIAQASPQEQNLQKYWRFRERFKNFVVPGNTQGGSMISSGREQYYQYTGSRITSGFLNYPDQTQFLGHYIGMLAMEYKLEVDHGLASSPTAAKTLQELAYALEAINRLDHNAEIFWHTYYDGPSCLFDSDAKNDLASKSLNGFFIREDVPADYANNIVNGNVVENLLNSSYFPVDDGRIVDVNKLGSSFTDDILSIGMFFTDGDPTCGDFEGKHLGPTEESLDQAIQLMMGLALTVRCVGIGARGYGYDGNPIDFSDGLGGIAEEAQAIAGRITKYMQVFSWLIQNPTTCSCVKGVKWSKDSGHCKCSDGGAIMELLCYGMVMANCRIQTANLGVSLGSLISANNYYCDNYDCTTDCATSSLCNPFIADSHDLILEASRETWDIARITVMPDDYKFCTLAAISHIWDEDTEASLYSRCQTAVDGGSEWHFPLLHNFLYPSPLINEFFNETLYENMMNTCECYSTHQADEQPTYNYWANASGLMYGGVNHVVSSTETNNLSYLFYFNLYNLYKPTYLSASASSYRFIEPSQLCETDIYKTGKKVNYNGNNTSDLVQFIESDQKGFHAANSINVQAGDNGTTYGIAYVIANDDDDQPWPLSQANVIYEAGKEVNLHAGFEVHNGAEFHATINRTLSPIACAGLESERTSNPNTNNQSNHPKMNTMSSEEASHLFNNLYQQEVTKQSNKVANTKQNGGINDITITPNPNNGAFALNTNSGSQKDIYVYDVNEKIIYQSKNVTDRVVNIDLTSQAGGIYSVRVVDGSTSITKKVIKQ